MSNTVTVRLQGGLGNQLFGWAAGYSLAKKHNSDLRLDTSLLKSNQYALDKYRLADHSLIQSGVWHPKIARLIAINRRKDFFEKDFTYDSEFESLGNCIRLNGYFQSWKYFEKYSQDIKTQLISLVEKSQQYVQLVEEFENRPSISVHVRRGDYVNLASFHGLTSRRYYRQAISLASRHLIKPSLFVFTDDIEMAKEVIDQDARFIGPKDLVSPNENIDLMARADALIGSNSSFSWWAAWLGDKEDKINIFPRPWFTNEQKNTKDLLPPNWITLGN